MRHPRSTSTSSILILFHLSHLIPQTTASPISDLWSELTNGTSILAARCANTCGFYGQVCCESGETCYTDQSNGEASCSAAAPMVTPAPSYSGGCDSCGSGSGSWIYWTSTFTSTDLVTYCSTYSSFQGYSSAAPQTTAQAVSCDTSSGESACGPICCDSSQQCQYEGQCAPAAGYGSSYVPTQTWYPTSSYYSYTAPLRPTSMMSSVPVVTTAPTLTSTVGFQPAVTTGSDVTIAASSGGGGLSGGAIAGIVIGVIAAIIILILICICCCVGATASSIGRFFGIGRKDKRRRTEEEYYHRHGSRADGRTWYGSGNRPQKRKGSGVGKKGILAGLAGFAAALGLAKREKNKRRDEKSSYSGSSYDYSSYMSGSSSDRRTRDTRRSRPDNRSRR